MWTETGLLQYFMIEDLLEKVIEELFVSAYSFDHMCH